MRKTGLTSERGVQRSALAVLLGGLVLFLFPILWMVSSSLKTEGEAQDPLRLLPASPQFGNYPTALGQMHFSDALANTVVVTVSRVLGLVVSCSLVGFGFAKFRFAGRNALFLLMLSTMMLPPQVTLIPVFILFRWLGLVDTLGPLILPAWVGAPFFVFMFRQFFSQVPDEVLEAARVDGASAWRIYWQMMLPMSWPVVAVVTVYAFIGAWNDYLMPLVYLNSPEKHTLALALASFTGRYGSTQIQLLMAASVVTMLPCVVLFFAAQRYFTAREMSAALKG